jgi:pimeloyl-ACP methyl ester carboxylesterase
MSPPCKLILTALTSLGLGFGTLSCSDRPATKPDINGTTISEPRLVHGAAAAGQGSRLEGDIGPGAHYVISMPEVWNGDLVLYAHGYTAPVFPVGIPPGEEVLVDGLRAIALQGGSAFAYSSYSQTGLGLRDAAQRTEQLSNLFVSIVGEPRRTLLIGTSFGGLAVLKLLEAHPERYAGAMTLCGMLGGARAEIDYVSHVRVLFDYFYPGVLPGSLYELPENFDIGNDLVVPVVAAIQANPQPALLLSQVEQTPVPAPGGPELVQSIVQALVLQAVELNDLLERTHGQGFFDNTQTVYTGNLPPELLADLNARVARYSDDPAAAQFLDQNYTPTGDLRVPLVSLHTSMDPVVPVLHESIYREAVEAMGRGEFLHQVTVQRYGHCTFTGEEIVAGFTQMLVEATLP